MLIYPEERLALFIDGANLYATARSLGMEIDYKNLKSYFSNKGRLIRAFYYTAILEDQEYSPLRPLIDWLDYNGFTLVTKPVKEFTDEHGRRKIKGNMDIEIAVDMLNISEALDHVVLFSGDGDFRRLLEAVQRRGVRVTVVSSHSTQPSMIADELRRQADQFVDLKELRDLVGRPSNGDDDDPVDAGYEDHLTD
ncbi:MAG: NYN domain-containing protein [Kordiimonas sp.]